MSKTSKRGGKSIEISLNKKDMNIRESFDITSKKEKKLTRKENEKNNI